MTTTQAVAGIADKYRQRGYTVVIDPTPGDLPDELPDFVPDFVAIRDNERIAVEVKSRRSLGGDSQLTRVAEALRQIPGWRLDIAVVDEPDDTRPVAMMSVTEVGRRLAAADRLSAEVGDHSAAVLLLWTGIEAVLLARLPPEYAERMIPTSRLAKLAYSHGLLDDSRFHQLESLMRVRNDVVHGRKTSDVTRNAYVQARALAESIVEARAPGHAAEAGT